jgi:hypothetical protein
MDVPLRSSSSISWVNSCETQAKWERGTIKLSLLMFTRVILSNDSSSFFFFFFFFHISFATFRGKPDSYFLNKKDIANKTGHYVLQKSSSQTLTVMAISSKSLQRMFWMPFRKRIFRCISAVVEKRGERRRIRKVRTRHDSCGENPTQFLCVSSWKNDLLHTK